MFQIPAVNNGLAPFEPEEIGKATTNSLDGNMEALKIAYTYDMIGNGPGRRNWGFMNMVLSDTEGNPYTTHVRKEAVSGRIFKKKFVDFYVDPTKRGGSDPNEDATVDTTYAKISRQHGAFPIKVADYLQGEMQQKFNSSKFESNNEPKDNVIRKKSFEALGFDGLFGNVNLLALPDKGYNVGVSVKFDEDAPGGGRVRFNRRARKKNADISLEYRDNARGTADPAAEHPYSYGFNLKLFLSDIVKEDEEFVNRPDDNARVIIQAVANQAAKVDKSSAAFDPGDENGDKDDSRNADSSILKWRKYEFLSTDNGLEGLDLTSYERFYETRQKAEAHIPQVYMLQDIIEKAGGTPPRSFEIKSLHDEVMTTLLKAFSKEVYENDNAFKYGAGLDDLTYDDVQYVNPENGRPYEEMTNDDGDPLTNEDGILGISKMQYNEEKGIGDKENRVFYLDPAKFGGNYINPPIYIKPVKNEGWLGFVNVMFPEIGPCKPYRADVIDFGSIQERINSTYSRIPEDERLKTDPDCVREEPYNRILERPAKAGIEGLISAAIRIYASVHLLKASATFTKFKPDFKNTFSTIYAQYIIEIMEEDFKDAQPSGFFEFFNPFKDEEFWYAFLEQAVQTYARRYADGQLTGSAVRCCGRTNKN